MVFNEKLDTAMQHVQRILDAKGGIDQVVAKKVGLSVGATRADAVRFFQSRTSDGKKKFTERCAKVTAELPPVTLSGPRYCELYTAGFRNSGQSLDELCGALVGGGNDLERAAIADGMKQEFKHPRLQVNNAA